MTKYLFTEPKDEEQIKGILANDFGMTYPPFNMQGYLVFPVRVSDSQYKEWTDICSTLRHKGIFFKTI